HAEERYQAVSDLRADLEAFNREHETRPAGASRRLGRDAHHGVPIVYASPLIQRVLDQVRAVAPTDATVLVRGESGVGKELIARRIHAESDRTGSFITVDCASIPADQLDGELFGSAAGAVAGQTVDHPVDSRWPIAAPCFLITSRRCRRQFRRSCCGRSRKGRSKGLAMGTHVARTSDSSPGPPEIPPGGSHKVGFGETFTSALPSAQSML